VAWGADVEVRGDPGDCNGGLLAESLSDFDFDWIAFGGGAQGAFGPAVFAKEGFEESESALLFALLNFLAIMGWSADIEMSWSYCLTFNKKNKPELKLLLALCGEDLGFIPLKPDFREHFHHFPDEKHQPVLPHARSWPRLEYNRKGEFPWSIVNMRLR
jgi:hypothetical protein